METNSCVLFRYFKIKNWASVSLCAFVAFIVFFCCLFIEKGYAQNVGINTTGAAPHPSAMLDVDANNRGLLIPRVSLTNVTVAAPVTSPATGLLVYNTNASVTGGNGTGFYYWTGSQWSRLDNSNSADWRLTGNSGTNPAINFLGTTDNQPLVIRTNNTERMRVLGSGQVGIGVTTPSERLEVSGNVGLRAGAAAFVGTLDNNRLELHANNQASLILNPPGSVPPGWSLQRDLAGNQRGLHAVDLQSARNNVINVASGNYSVISGGLNNQASGISSVVSGGEDNRSTQYYATVSGGRNNQAINEYSTIGGGGNNTVSGYASTIGGGASNNVSGSHSVISGGSFNQVSGNNSYIGGGSNNNITGAYSSIPGGSYLKLGSRSFGFSASIFPSTTDLSSFSSIAAFVDADLWLYNRSNSASQLRLYEPTNSTTGVADYSAFRAQNQTSSITYTLPASLTPTSTIQPLILQSDNNGYLSWLSSSALLSNNAWNLAGNSGTNPANNFLGTTDNNPLIIRTNNSERLRIASNGNIGIGITSPSERLVINGNLGLQANAPAFLGTLDDYRLELRVNNQPSLILHPPGAFGPSVWAIQRDLGGNQRGVHAIDLQSNRTAATQVASGSYSVIVGGSNNTASADYSIVVGGLENVANGPLSCVTSGYLNTCGGYNSFIGGGEENNVSNVFCTIGGGRMNVASGGVSTIGGGYLNAATAQWSTVSGGTQNSATATACTVAGGQNNIASSNLSTVSGGYYNTASGAYSAINGGYYNTASGEGSIVGGGYSNSAGQDFSVVCGGFSNTAGNYAATVVGGRENVANGYFSTLVGGFQNLTNAAYGFVGGGLGNRVDALFGTIAGGGPVDTASVGPDNSLLYVSRVTDNYGTIGGGSFNHAGNADIDPTNASFATVGGGFGNAAAGYRSAIVGGAYNYASGVASIVAGGSNNSASGEIAVITGGQLNNASGYGSFIGGGNQNSSSANFSIVNGGELNAATGTFSTVVGGYSNTANANHVMVYGENVDPSVSETHRVYFFGDGSALRPSGFLVINRLNGDYPIHVGVNNTNGNGAYLSTGGTWTNASTREKKDRFAKLNPIEILARINQLPVEGWYYKGTEEYHIGPYAEDFYAAFGTGVHEIIETDSTGKIVRRPNPEVNKYLAASDVAGVALLGVKALSERSEAVENRQNALEARLETLIQEIERLKAENQQLKSQIERLHNRESEGLRAAKD